MPWRKEICWGRFLTNFCASRDRRLWETIERSNELPWATCWEAVEKRVRHPGPTHTFCRIFVGFDVEPPIFRNTCQHAILICLASP